MADIVQHQAQGLETVTDAAQVFGQGDMKEIQSKGFIDDMAEERAKGKLVVFFPFRCQDFFGELPGGVIKKF